MTDTFQDLPNGTRLHIASDQIDLPDQPRLPELIFLKYGVAAVQEDGPLLFKVLSPTAAVSALPALPESELPDMDDPGAGLKGSWALRGHEWAVLKELALSPLEPAETDLLWSRCRATIPLMGFLLSRGRFTIAVDVLKGRQLVVADGGGYRLTGFGILRAAAEHLLLLA